MVERQPRAGRDEGDTQVLTQARAPLIERTFESLKGAKRAIMHLYNSTSTTQRRVVFNLDRPGIKQIAVDAAIVVRDCAAKQPDTAWTFQYSPESFTGTELDYAKEVCDAVLDVWQADSGTLTPVVDDADSLTETCENLWLRPSGAEPWEYDVILMDATPTTWTYKRDARVSRPLEDILWTIDGIRYLRPEVQLMHKARGLRPKDQVDFEVCAPLLDGGARGWLRSALELAHPGSHRGCPPAQVLADPEAGRAVAALPPRVHGLLRHLQELRDAAEVPQVVSFGVRRVRCGHAHRAS